VRIAKLVAGLLTGSAAMLSEAAHSVGDTMTEVLVLTALRRSQRPADRRHPFGYGKERYVFSLLAAVSIFVARRCSPSTRASTRCWAARRNARTAARSRTSPMAPTRPRRARATFPERPRASRPGTSLHAMAADPDVTPVRFTVEQYERMGETTILDPNSRYELLDGVITMMSPSGPLHAGTVNQIAALTSHRLFGLATITVRNPIRLGNRSEPQPDIVIARLRRDFYKSAHPAAEDTLVAIEVSDSTLRTDRLVKLPISQRRVWARYGSSRSTPARSRCTGSPTARRTATCAPTRATNRSRPPRSRT